MSALVLLSLVLAQDPTPPPTAELPGWLQKAPKSFDEARDELARRLGELPGVEVEVRPIPAFSEEERAELVERMREKLQRIGVRGDTGVRVAEERVAEVVAQPAGDNVVAILPGRTAEAGGRRLIVAAPLGTPGIRVGCLDGWTGCALLVELARHFQEQPLEHSLVLLACGGEALGHRGAEVFVAGQSEEELARTDAAVFVQGFGSSGLHAWMEGSTDGLMLTARAVAQRTGDALELRRFADLGRPSGLTVALHARQVPGLFLDGIADAQLFQLRTAADKPALLDPEFVERTVRYVQELLLELDAQEEPMSWESALTRYEVAAEDARAALSFVRYRLNGPRGIEVLGDDPGAPSRGQKDPPKVTESPNPGRKGPTPPATTETRADDEKLP